MAENIAHPYNRRRVLTIDDLPDDVLLEIFDFYVVKYEYPDYRWFCAYNSQRRIESWQSLVHVCRRWRCLVFGSPRRLNLQICYHSPGRLTRKSLDAWPTLPLRIWGSFTEELLNNVIPGLEHRISQIHLSSSAWPQTENFSRAVQVPFPELVALYLAYGVVLLDSFLGGSAPRLRYICLNSISFPGLPKLLLSATHLVKLWLHSIPPSGYISPGAMATCLSMLTSLDTLHLEFEPDQSYPDLKSRPPFPPTRSVLPTLALFRFKGVNIYLEDFVARIDAPQLYRFSTTFFIDTYFKVADFNQFISCAPTLGPYGDARLSLDCRQALVRLRPSYPEPSDDRMVEVEISTQDINQRVSILGQTCNSSLRLLLTMENLYIDGGLYDRSNINPSHVWNHDTGNTEWLDLLLPFTAVKNLYVSKLFTPRIALVLQELTRRRTTEVLPALQNVLLERFEPSEVLEGVQEGITQFISARQLIDRPVVISVWDRRPWDNCREVDG